ncbi:SDR family NAD(P)-dependent oxidoreductase [Sphaerisporangium album]|uniref:SDR family NAD(P)-dependent oxidoreductase n=1 Tax=Sphaerisporangium album TaxID=509200 RepID=A0A367FT61_9ACTN|nr:oxidoreductase [Sphaerisporangium album]RCG32775.1 SDR family NAD(P)-dependent oxidoreductase [Sphaerisporangium album]
MEKIWIVTGAASGLGREVARAALEEGDVVVATDRDTAGAAVLADAHGDAVDTVQLDVTDLGRVDEVVADVVRRHGRIDVLVNAAGRGHIGAVEETSDTELRRLMELHFFGPAALTRAVLPHMRAQRSGAIVQISSLAGQLSVPGMSAYSAGKFALEGFSVALAQEVAPLGIKVLIGQPGAMRTNFAGPAISESERIADYEATVGGLRKHVAEVTGQQPGDPERVAAALLTALAAEDTPVRLPLGNDAFDRLTADADRTQQDRVAWEEVSRGTDF